MKHGDPIQNPRLYWGLSYASGYFHLGMLEDASCELEQLGKALQKHPEVLSLKGLILLARKRWREVIEQCQFAHQLYPESPDFYIQAAYAYDKLNKPSEAREIWYSAPESVRTSLVYHYNIARCEARLGNREAALEHVRAVLTLAPEMVTTMSKDPNLKDLVGESLS